MGTLDDLTLQIEAIPVDPDLSPEDQAALLGDLRRTLVDLTGRIDQYLAGAKKAAQASVKPADSPAVEEARHNATLRSEILKRGMASPDELDAAGLWSHEELDRLAEEGLLEEAAVGLVAATRALRMADGETEDPCEPVIPEFEEVPDLDLAQEARYREVLHPRGRGGKWVEKPGHRVDVSNAADTVKAVATGRRGVPLPPDEAHAPHPLGHGEPPTANTFRKDEGVRKPGQPFDTEDALMSAAERAQAPFTEMMTEVAHEIGATTYVEHGLAEAGADAGDHPDTPQVIVGKVKAREVAAKKVAAKYDGDWGRLTDTVRGTVTVPKEDDIPAAVAHIRAAASKRGWKIVGAENRHARVPRTPNVGPLPGGYVDASVSLVNEEGLQMEVQILTTPMFHAKMTEGHDIYEKIRAIHRDAAISRRDPSTEEQATLRELTRRSEQVYAQAREKGKA